MGWTFHTADQSQKTPRAQAEQTASHVKHLEHREADLVRRLVTLKERHAFFPHEVTNRQIDELAAKLEQLRTELDTARADLPPDPHAA
jgi:chromosome segregation ATPase